METTIINYFNNCKWYKIKKELNALDDIDMFNDLNNIVDKTRYLSNTIEQLDNFINNDEHFTKINLQKINI